MSYCKQAGIFWADGSICMNHNDRKTTSYNYSKAGNLIKPLIIWILSNRLSYSDKDFALHRNRKITPFSEFKSKYMKTIPIDVKLKYIKILHTGLSTISLEDFYKNYPHITPCTCADSIESLTVTKKNIHILNTFVKLFSRSGIKKEYNRLQLADEHYTRHSKNIQSRLNNDDNLHEIRNIYFNK